MTWSFPSDWAGLKYPHRRAELYQFFMELADPAFQATEWTTTSGECMGDNGIDPIVHFLFDDTDLGEDAASQVGLILLDAFEVDAVGKVAGLLDKIVNDVGDASSAAFLAHPLWPEVVRQAGQAYETLARSGVPTWVADKA